MIRRQSLTIAVLCPSKQAYIIVILSSGTLEEVRGSISQSCWRVWAHKGHVKRSGTVLAGECSENWGRGQRVQVLSRSLIIVESAGALKGSSGITDGLGRHVAVANYKDKSFIKDIKEPQPMTVLLSRPLICVTKVHVTEMEIPTTRNLWLEEKDTAPEFRNN